MINDSLVPPGNISNCSGFDDGGTERDPVEHLCSFWIQGIFLLTIGTIGVIGNAVSAHYWLAL